MRIASAAGRLVIAQDDRWFDVEQASKGQFSADPQAIYDTWETFRIWASNTVGALSDAVDVEGDGFDVPVPRPRQVMAIGLNYREHAAESNFEPPEHPVVFTKFASSLTGHGATVVLPSDGVDWEVEMVVVIGREGHQIPVEKAWDHVAGLTVGQDLSWREVQTRGPAPQFAIAKSYPGFSPLGPVVVTPEEFPDRDDLAISCALDGELLQSGRTRDLIFPVAELIAYLSEALTLMPGDLIFTGTPAGVGVGRHPQRFLVPGQLVSSIEGIGDLTIDLVR